MVAGGNSIKSNTGKASITKQGHTTSGAHGSGYNKKRRYPSSTSNLNAK